MCLADSLFNRLPTSRQGLYRKLFDIVTGKTCLHEVTLLEIPNSNRIFLKLEYQNIGGVHHSRIYPFIFALAEIRGFIVPGVTPVIETSAGGAAIAFTFCANYLGFDKPHRPQVVVPSYLSPARLAKLRKLKAIVHKVYPGEGNDSTVHYLEKILVADRNEKGGRIGDNLNRLYCCTKTQTGTENAYATLAEESTRQLMELYPQKGYFDYFVGCVGSGSSISGVGRRLKSVNPGLRVFAAEHALTPVAYSLKLGKKLDFDRYPHPFHGASHWGVNADKLNIDFDLIDGFLSFDTTSAEKMQEIVNNVEGLSIGLTTSGAIAAAYRLAEQVGNKNILIIAYDSYEQSRLSRTARAVS